MASDILNGRSTNELSKEIKRLVLEDQRSLPEKPKLFAAIAKLQGFDVLPEVGTIDQIEEQISKGFIELNRGLSSTRGIPSHFYARELIFGSMYPGTLSALGNGMYFAVPGDKIPKEELDKWPGFPRISTVAMKYVKGEGSGALVRAALKKTAKIADCHDLKQYFKENRNRAKLAGITDIGAFSASLGFDAYYADNVYEDTNERVFVVLNRGALLIQKQGILVKI
jgi:hypothetical protein